MARLNPNILRLYLVTDQTLMHGDSLMDVVSFALQGGVTCVQLREKNLDTRSFLAKAQALKSLLSPHAVPLVINDRIDIALACGADGVHLGQSDMPPELARTLLLSHVFIGWSVETMEQVKKSVLLPVDYLGISPVFMTPTKTNTGKAWGLQGLAAARLATSLPLVAIGGIHSGNALQVINAGADGLAVVSALCAADDPLAAASCLKSLCDDALKQRETTNFNP